MTDLTPTQILDDELNMQNLEAELSAIPLDEVTRAIKDIADGRPVVVVDDADRENEGDIIFAASKATPELLAFTIRYSSGVICVPMRGADLDRLHIPLMTTQNPERMRTALHDRGRRADGITTGISAADRATTIQHLAGPQHRRRPRPAGPHLPAPARRGRRAAPARPHRGGGRPGRAGRACRRSAWCARSISDDGTMMRLPGLRKFADEHGLALISIEQLIEHRRRTERLVTRVAETVIPNAYGRWNAYGYRSDIDGTEHLALVYGDLSRRRRRGRPHPGALRVPDRRRVRLAPLRLRRPARRGHGQDRRARPRRRPLPPRPRGPGHRPALQAAGLRAAGQRRRHGGRQPRTRPPGRRPRVLGRRPAPRATSASARSGCSPTTRPRSTRSPPTASASPGSRCPRSPPPTTSATWPPSATASATKSPSRPRLTTARSHRHRQPTRHRNPQPSTATSLDARPSPITDATSSPPLAVPPTTATLDSHSLRSSASDAEPSTQSSATTWRSTDRRRRFSIADRPGPSAVRQRAANVIRLDHEIRQIRRT